MKNKKRLELGGNIYGKINYKKMFKMWGVSKSI